MKQLSDENDNINTLTASEVQEQIKYGAVRPETRWELGEVGKNNVHKQQKGKL